LRGEVRLDTLSADSLKRAFATAKELAANNGAPPIQEPKGYRHVKRASCIWTGPRFFRSSRPQQLIAGEVVSLKTLAADDVLDPTEIRRLLPPPVSVPTIVEAILAGNQPANLTVKA
jgi:hypothetical protein